MKSLWFATSLALAAGCHSTEPEAAEAALVKLDEVFLLDPQDDSFPEHRPANDSCKKAIPLIEPTSLEFNTEDCDYFVVGLPIIQNIQDDASLKILFWHSALASAEPSEAHIALSIEGLLLWEVKPPIPSSSAVYQPTISGFTAAAGDILVIHLHNHGQNSYDFGGISVFP